MASPNRESSDRPERRRSISRYSPRGKTYGKRSDDPTQRLPASRDGSEAERPPDLDPTWPTHASISRLRKAPKSPLGTVASDRLYRMAVLYSLAEEVLEDEEMAREWLRTPQVGLNNRIPLDLMNTEAGAREVEDLLGRIEHGVHS